MTTCLHLFGSFSLEEKSSSLDGLRERKGTLLEKNENGDDWRRKVGDDDIEEKINGTLL